jgi:hypothetical protein
VGDKRVLKYDSEVALQLHVFFQQRVHAHFGEQQHVTIGQRFGGVIIGSILHITGEVARPLTAGGKLQHMIVAVGISKISHQATGADVGEILGGITGMLQEITLLEVLRHERGNQEVLLLLG